MMLLEMLRTLLSAVVAGILAYEWHLGYQATAFGMFAFIVFEKLDDIRRKR